MLVVQTHESGIVGHIMPRGCLQHLTRELPIKLFVRNLQTPMQRLVKRMTRVFTKLGPDEATKKLTVVLEKMGYNWKKTMARQVGHYYLIA